MNTHPFPELRPLSLGQILDRGIRLYRNNFLLFIGIFIVTQIPTFALGMSAIFVAGDLDIIFEQPGQYVEFIIVAIVIGLLGWLLTLLASAALSRTAAEKYLGQEIGLLEAYHRVKNDWTKLVMATVVSVLLAITIVIWTLVPCVGWLTGAGMLWFYSSIIVPMLTPVIILEKRAGSTAFFRCWELGRRKFWDVVRFGFLVLIMGEVLTTGPSLLIELFLTSAMGFEQTSQVVPIVQQVVGTLIRIVYLPIPIICFTLLYIDLRVKTEGFDLHLQSVEPEEKSSIGQVFYSNNFVQAWKPTGEEMGYFLGVTLLTGIYGFVLDLIGLGVSFF